MSTLPRIKPLRHVQVSNPLLEGEYCGRPARVLWDVRPGTARGSEGPYGWCVTEPWPEEVKVTFLAKLLRVKPFKIVVVVQFENCTTTKIVADLLALGILVNTERIVPFETALQLLRHHGYTIAEA